MHSSVGVLPAQFFRENVFSALLKTFSRNIKRERAHGWWQEGNSSIDSSETSNRSRKGTSRISSAETWIVKIPESIGVKILDSEASDRAIGTKQIHVDNTDASLFLSVRYLLSRLTLPQKKEVER